MTNDEKAKAYDMALEAARKELGVDRKEWKVVQRVLHSIFPELRESEDEIHRKWILEYLYDGLRKADEQFKDHFKSAIDWLEKQKEQKSVGKPINWTELTWKDIVELEGIINNVHYEFRNGIGQESFGKEVLEKFREYKGDEYLDEIEQKPAEWKDYKDKVNIPYCSSEPEWSEEDEGYINAIIAIINRETALYPKGGATEDLNNTLIDWLKSIRPSWKPSEEQMTMLRAIINDPNNAGAESCHLVMKSLYEQLEKL